MRAVPCIARGAPDWRLAVSVRGEGGLGKPCWHKLSTQLRKLRAAKQSEVVCPGGGACAGPANMANVEVGELPDISTIARGAGEAWGSGACPVRLEARPSCRLCGVPWRGGAWAPCCVMSFAEFL